MPCPRCQAEQERVEIIDGVCPRCNTVWRRGEFGEMIVDTDNRQEHQT